MATRKKVFGMAYAEKEQASIELQLARLQRRAKRASARLQRAADATRAKANGWVEKKREAQTLALYADALGAAAHFCDNAHRDCVTAYWSRFAKPAGK